MQCPECGNESTYGLNYCKQCGTNLTPQPGAAEQGTSYARLTGKLSGMFWAIAVFALASFTVLFGVTIPLTVFGAGKQIIIPMLIFGCGGIFGVAAMLVKQLSRLITMAEKAERPSQSRRLKPRPDYSYPQLNPEPGVMSSVTEHTTRNFEQVYREPGSPE